MITKGNTMTQQELKALIKEYKMLVDNYEFQPDNHTSRMLKEFLNKYPNIARNYDLRGNFIGVVPNEDGWAA